MQKIIKQFVILTLLAFFSISSFAIPSLDIDFRDWTGAEGNASYTVGNVTARALPDNTNNPDRAGSILYQDAYDGLGIKESDCGYEVDEIDSCERLRVSFDWDLDPSYYVTGVWVTDLFDAADGSFNAGERGRVQIRVDGVNTNFTIFGEDSNQGNGEQYIDFGGAFQMSRVDFWVPGYNSNAGNETNEFSVAGFTILTVNEPGSLLLFGIGLIGLGLARRIRIDA